LIAQLKSERGTELDLHHVLLLSETDRFAVADKLDCSPLKVKTLWELFETTVKSRMLDVNRKLKVKTLEI
jgi:hypothetical protein